MGKGGNKPVTMAKPTLHDVVSGQCATGWGQQSFRMQTMLTVTRFITFTLFSTKIILFTNLNWGNALGKAGFPIHSPDMVFASADDNLRLRSLSQPRKRWLEFFFSFLFITEKFKFSFNSCCMKQVFLCCALIWKSSFFLYVHVFIYLKALQTSRFPYAFSQRCSVLVKCPHIPSFTQP